MSSESANIHDFPPVVITSCVVNEVQIATPDPAVVETVIQIDAEWATESGGQFAQSFQVPLALWLNIKEKIR